MIASNFSRAVSALALGAAFALPAQAALVDLEDVAAGFLAPSVTSGGMDFTSGGTGFSGVDSAAAFLFGNAPDGSTGQFLYALNNDSVTLSAGGGYFRLLGFDAAFIAPFTQAPGTVAGLLRIAAMTADGLVESEVDFGLAGATGNWAFFSALAPTFDSVSSVTFSACIYDGLGGCIVDQALPAAFALDNLSVPEPGSVALTLAALGLLAATRRRQTV